MRQKLMFPMACLFSIAAAITACAMDRTGSSQESGMAQDQQSQQEKGRQIVSDSQRERQGGMQGDEATASDQQRARQQLGAEGSAMGVPEPGTVSDQESTQKQRNPARQHSATENAQVTLGGSKSPVYGLVIRVNGDNFFVKDLESGDEIRLIVNTDTNMDCGRAPSSGGTLSTDRHPDQSNMGSRQGMQGQRRNETATGSGFKAGDCSFNSGDHVKAEVSDIGTVTTLKFLPEDEIQRHQQSSSGQR